MENNIMNNEEIMNEAVELCENGNSFNPLAGVLIVTAIVAVAGGVVAFVKAKRKKNQVVEAEEVEIISEETQEG